MKSLKTFLEERFSSEERAEIRRRAKEKLAGIKLQKLREECHLTQAEAAHAMGVSQAALSKMERRPNVTVGALQRYVEALGCRLEVNVLKPVGFPTAIGKSKGAGRRKRLAQGQRRAALRMHRVHLIAG
jgi:transcriptional regulator with XRE-family HTH domain